MRNAAGTINDHVPHAELYPGHGKKIRKQHRNSYMVSKYELPKFILGIWIGDGLSIQGRPLTE